MFTGCATRLPCQDLDRARAFYAEKLGLEPSEERPGGILYRFGDGSFALFQSSGRSSGDHTQMGFEVDDIEATVADLRARGLELLSFELPGVTERDGIVEVPGNYPSKGTGERDGIVEVPGNYPSKGTGERAVWFRDSEGNLLGIGQAI